MSAELKLWVSLFIASKKWCFILNSLLTLWKLNMEMIEHDKAPPGLHIWLWQRYPVLQGSRNPLLLQSVHSHSNWKWGKNIAKVREKYHQWYKTPLKIFSWLVHLSTAWFFCPVGFKFLFSKCVGLSLVFQIKLPRWRQDITEISTSRSNRFVCISSFRIDLLIY